MIGGDWIGLEEGHQNGTGIMCECLPVWVCKFVGARQKNARDTRCRNESRSVAGNGGEKKGKRKKKRGGPAERVGGTNLHHDPRTRERYLASLMLFLIILKEDF